MGEHNYKEDQVSNGQEHPAKIRGQDALTNTHLPLKSMV